MRVLLRRLRGAMTWRRVVVVWVLLVFASQVFTRAVGVGPPMGGGVSETGGVAIDLEVAAMGDGGAVGGGEPVGLRVWKWEGGSGGGGRLPLVLLHGSPSSGGLDFDEFGALLAAGGLGRDVYALDRVGYGGSAKWVPSYSVKANARYVLAMMDALGIERAHVGGWSYSGGVALWMAELAPERVASIGMIGAIGVQEGEGSGSYHFEHFKYLMGFPLVVGLPELVPHFGLLGPTWFRHAFIRDFWDTDQRPLRGIMERLETPTLILQGRDDPLVRASTAEAHHELIGPSRLVTMDASHFFPMGPPMGRAEDTRFAAGVYGGFVDRHDEAGVVVRRGEADFSPAPAAEPLRLGGFEIDLRRDWWMLVVLIGLLTLVSEDLTVVATGLAVGTGNLDFAVGLLGCMVGILVGDYGLWAVGRFGGTRLLRVRPFNRLITQQTLDHWSGVLGKHTAKAVIASRMLPGTRLPMYVAVGIIPGHNKKFFFWMFVAVSVWTPLLLVLTLLVGPPVLGFFRDVFHGPWAIVAAFVVLALLLRVVSLEATEVGRQRLKADVKRLWASEFWPRWLFYLPLAPWIVFLGLRYRGFSVFTAANPGIGHGGGLLNEPKGEITDALRESGAPVLEGVVVGREGSAEERLGVVEGWMEERGLGWPVVLKPLSGERGRGVRVVRGREQALSYLDEHREALQAQRYHPGPVEIGVMWAREPGALGEGGVDGLGGGVFSVTRKVWPEVVGDGERRLEMLIWGHPRYRMQAPVFLRRFEDRLDEVLGDGERLRLAQAGNHAQGTMFVDGGDLLTDELRAWVDGVARVYRDPATGGRLDFGRFDVRAESEEAVRRAEGLAIIELNGTLAESTNVYDPSWSLVRRYALLYRQWRRLFRLGALRRAEGGRPLGFVGVAGELWSHVRFGGPRDAD